jgi:hypothetical protein
MNNKTQKAIITNILFLLSVGVWLTSTAKAFNHPGILHSQADLDRIKNNVAANIEPWKTGYAMFAAHPKSQSNYTKLGPYSIVCRDTGGGDCGGNAVWESDSSAAYQNAVMWYITGTQAYANKAIEIMDAWSSTLTGFDGADAKLAASLGGWKFANAAEIIRYTYPCWTQQGINNMISMLTDVVYPVIQDYGDSNWGSGCIKTIMSIGIFCDDQAKFDDAVNNYRTNTCCSLTRMILPSGQCSESGRDQEHTQLGIAHLAETAEIAWKQGTDLYSDANNRLLAGFEYTAKYNLGYDGPFESFGSCGVTYAFISAIDRGQLRPNYEMVWNHYVNRMGVAAPYTKAAVDYLWAEGDSYKGDHPGFGTLLFSLTAWSPSLPALPSPWQNQNVGSAVAGYGSSTYGNDGNGVFTVKGSGSDIWGSADAFQYAYIPVSGNCEIKARVAGLALSRRSDWAKAGVMIRETLSSGSRHASVYVTYKSGVNFERRTSTSGTTSRTAATGLVVPYWVRVKRTGSTFEGFRSADGTNWTSMGTVSITTMASNVYIGLPVCSVGAGTGCRATFDSVAVTASGMPSPPSAPTNLTATAASPDYLLHFMDPRSVTEQP